MFILEMFKVFKWLSNNLQRFYGVYVEVFNIFFICLSRNIHTFLEFDRKTFYISIIASIYVFGAGSVNCLLYICTGYIYLAFAFVFLTGFVYIEMYVHIVGGDVID